MPASRASAGQRGPARPCAALCAVGNGYLATRGAAPEAVVVGRRGGLTGLRLGSVPHGLIRGAPCPVVTVGAGPGADEPLNRER
ncbi:universal stress protein [Kitasatospora phosalacinea]|uniref:UspA domain-containing protein n=1 Tax=Kitasatospora phosalacinea TaxID=2065 RepID=A0A9W6UTZ2_9ACTN|nr:hypothetical protein Kpho01_76170 [Kitasatospora phosalacinea]